MKQIAIVLLAHMPRFCISVHNDKQAVMQSPFRTLNQVSVALLLIDLLVLLRLQLLVPGHFQHELVHHCPALLLLLLLNFQILSLQ